MGRCDLHYIPFCGICHSIHVEGERLSKIRIQNVTPTLALLGKHAGISVNEMIKELDRGISILALLEWIGSCLEAEGKTIIRIEV
jgi:hypothetical protein